MTHEFEIGEKSERGKLRSAGHTFRDITRSFDVSSTFQFRIYVLSSSWVVHDFSRTVIVPWEHKEKKYYKAALQQLWAVQNCEIEGAQCHLFVNLFSASQQAASRHVSCLQCSRGPRVQSRLTLFAHSTNAPQCSFHWKRTSTRSPFAWLGIKTWKQNWKTHWLVQ